MVPMPQAWDWEFSESPMTVETDVRDSPGGAVLIDAVVGAVVGNLDTEVGTANRVDPPEMRPGAGVGHQPAAVRPTVNG